MKVATLVFVINAACVSPSEQLVGSTEIYKIPCAGLRYEEIAANPFKKAQEPNVPLAGPTLAEPSVEAAQRPRRKSVDSISPKGITKAARTCGSKRVIWYWKNHRKKWRCR